MPILDSSDPVDVSIVIVSFNTRNVLRECLQSIERESGGLRVEILVVDNHSSDGSPEMIESDFPRVRLFRSEVNLGFASANNAARSGDVPQAGFPRSPSRPAGASGRADLYGVGTDLRQCR